MNVTYLFGAGASIGTIPVVKDFIKGINELISVLINKSSNQGKEDLINTLQYLEKEIPSYASIDTLIRKLHIQNNHYEVKLNAGLIAVIHYLQLIKEIDKRYDLFLGNLININENKISLPKNVNFVSWNYDRLFELSLCSLLDSNGNLNLVRKHLNIFNNYETIENEMNPYLIKLNGSAGAFLDMHTKNNSIENVLNEVIQNYHLAFEKKIPKALIQFAWDENENTKISREKAIEIMYQTNILVVIGYSFPTFNRAIDKELLRTHNTFDRIVVQNTKSNIDSVCDRLRVLAPLIEPHKIVKVTEENEFHLPIEI